MYQDPVASTSGRDGPASAPPACDRDNRCPSASSSCGPSSSSNRRLSLPSATALLLATACLLPGACLAGYDGSWHKARGTNYGAEDDGWNINEGSCGYGYLDRDKSTGWDIVALSDTNWDYSGSCGRCVEVRCDPAWIGDNYGGSYDRTGVCRDPEASVVVQVTDSCPCNYPANAYSNKRWCCGDMYHMDLSAWAFEKLAEKRWGVIGLVFRPVSCDYQPDKRAPSPPEGESRPNQRISRPWGWTDRRPWP
ncbi:hypothetical protein GPECTOR_46g245 [Gonium pectorale]|uniref:Expansin-like EG45 domain-containing protein n=1 Tax=Gonium pectorale TaxID=33097 RepID=A0A150G8I7_GONPE|nr:hypothetical protein GPECTOR_46g245 [Gonium pectorale]|eukprot:KXZ46176.1 hypothetical protein GPECTOR_46g245 [Gonium pectorale]